MLISDNGTVFKAGAKVVQRVIDDPNFKKHFTGLQVDWTFNLERASWWGGFFEQLIRCVKVFMKKTI